MLVRAQTILPFRTNIPTDVISNTMWFQAASELSLAECAEAIAPNLHAFYSAVYAPVSGTGVLATYVDGASVFVNFYDQDQPAPRVPWREDLPTLSVTTQDTVIPTEVACVLSYRAALENGVPAARRRGRIFIGGLGDGAMIASSAASPYFPRWTATFRTNVAAAAVDNLLEPEDWGGEVPAEDIVWSVYSQTDGFAAPIVAGWVDNTPDTQRRRGVASTSRTVWPS